MVASDFTEKKKKGTERHCLDIKRSREKYGGSRQTKEQSKEEI